MRLAPWLLEVVVCPGCGGRLAVVPGRAPMVGCRRCRARYPLLGGVPVLVPSPAEYLAGYRDAALATLAEHAAATRAAVAVVDGFASAAPRTEPLAFGDDWVAGEGDAPQSPAGASPAAATFARFLAEARDALDDTLLAELPARRRTIVEVGAGAGTLARRLATTPGVERLVVADLSLRAALRAATRRGPRITRRRAAIAAAVLDAEHLPLSPGAADVIIAAELLDLLAAPAQFLAAAAVALHPRGRLLLATPDPALGGSDPDRLLSLLTTSRWHVVAHHRAIPWLRAHTPRHYQVYFADVLAAER